MSKLDKAIEFTSRIYPNRSAAERQGQQHALTVLRCLQDTPENVERVAQIMRENGCDFLAASSSQVADEVLAALRGVGMGRLSEAPEKTHTLELCEWEGHPHCVYLNNRRIAGGKPWGGGKIIRTWKVRDIDLREALAAAGKEDGDG